MNSKLKKKLDKVFSEYIRQRDADENGYVRCISCGVARHWKEVDAGHFISRRHLSTRYDEANVWGQCKRCNSFPDGATMQSFREAIIQKHGAQKPDELEYKSRNITKITDKEAELLIEYYKKNENS